METQAKLLNINYIETRLRDFSQIKNGSVGYTILKSNRTFSKSIYVNFWFVNPDGKIGRENQLRISDHPSSAPNTLLDFVVEPSENLTKKKKKQFMDTLEKAVKYAQQKRLKYLMKNIDKFTGTKEREL